MSAKVGFVVFLSLVIMLGAVWGWLIWDDRSDKTRACQERGGQYVKVWDGYKCLDVKVIP